MSNIDFETKKRGGLTLERSVIYFCSITTIIFSAIIWLEDISQLDTALTVGCIIMNLILIQAMRYRTALRQDAYSDESNPLLKG
ncbi:hypothetical protein AL013_13165 [Mariprofundus ferrooxydans]|uniref:Uncharacterized protein n=1 Tax=Mariprofundus ferrooxydans PV-1 TaxID=314345 RepID=Q0F3D1_9PROT|nr:hypothetical protein SPV1_04298 [Mariprofundus ferrooxydans PV-1]KON46435.1 hypothetical protein AL013_13165 [Mariprofundus ferrooxydans]